MKPQKLKLSRFCNACGERLFDDRHPSLAAPVFRGKPYCTECFAELSGGIIPPDSNLLRKAASRYGPLDDAGPWQENAIRALEGD